MIINIFNDCKDTNALSRQNVRFAALFPGAQIYSFGVEKDIEVAGCVVDILDAGLNEPQIIVGNMAPRGDKRYENGCPFSFSKIGNTLIVGTVPIFSLLKKLGIINEIKETDVYEVCRKFLNEERAQIISNSQFRSYEYLPRLAKWIWEEKNVPSKKIDIPDSKKEYIWFIDNFGNCKTTLTEKSELKNKFAKLPYFERLADVPLGILSVTKGSSGYKDRRFLEIVLQKDSAAKKYKLKVGQRI